MFAYVSQKIEYVEPFRPIEVIHQHRRIVPTVKIEKLTELRLDTLYPSRDHIGGIELALTVFETRVADHPRSAANQRNRLMPGHLETF